MNELSLRWRAEFGWGILASFIFAVPSLTGQLVLGRALGRVQEMAALLSLGSASGEHLLFQPLDMFVGGGVRLVVLAAFTGLLLRVMMGVALPFQGTLAALSRAARVLAWAPLPAALLAGGAAWVWFQKPSWAGDPALWELAYPCMKAWVGLQGLLWIWVLLRLGRLLAREHNIGRAEAMFVGLAPAWALVLVALVEGALP